MDTQFFTEVLVVGGGVAGTSAILHLRSKDVTLIESSGSNTAVAAWNIMIRDADQLAEVMLRAGEEMNDRELLSVFVDRHSSAVSELESLGVRFRKSNIGLIPKLRSVGAGMHAILRSHVSGKEPKIIRGRVVSFLVGRDNPGHVEGVVVLTQDGGEISVFCRHLILAGGGMSGIYPFSTGESRVNGSLLALAYDAGIELIDIEFSMFHPFLIVDSRFPRHLISGEILTRMNFTDADGHPFLSEVAADALRNNRHHWMFSFITREFYLQSLRGGIFAVIDADREWFERFKSDDEFGFVFSGHSLDDIGKIEIHPAFHFTLGGVRVDAFSRSNMENVYVVGEMAGGLHGAGRVGGTALIEGWIFGRRAAEHVNDRPDGREAWKGNRDIVRTSEGHTGVSSEARAYVWKALGPVRNGPDLLTAGKWLRDNALSAEERLIGAMVNASLLREETVGAFIREDFPTVRDKRHSYVCGTNVRFE
ncbi:MAG: FAD-binding protein [Candidatus Moranbacteria bacterium]|nr:FAD-binding protein [Candidatus Moranbacteria bacterium]